MPKGLGQGTAAASSSSRREALRTAATRLISPLEEGLKAPLPEGAGDFLTLPLDEIRPDPTNPRWSGKTPPTWDEVRNPESVADLNMRKELEVMHGLAASYEEGGQRQPIEVCKVDGWFQIIDGERRYWALRLAGKPHAVVKLLPELPARLKLIQFIATFQHRTFAFREQLLALQQILVEAANAGKPIESANTLITAVGFTRPTGFRWWGILKGPEDVHRAVASSVITTMRDAYLISQEKDPARRRQMIDDPAQRLPVETRIEKRPHRKTGNSRGRRAHHVSFGRTDSLPLAKAIITRLSPEGSHAEVDWDDYKQVTKLWKDLLEQLAKDLIGGN